MIWCENRPQEFENLRSKIIEIIKQRSSAKLSDISLNEISTQLALLFETKIISLLKRQRLKVADMIVNYPNDSIKEMVIDILKGKFE